MSNDKIHPSKVLPYTEIELPTANLSWILVHYSFHITLGEIDTSIQGALIIHELSIKYRGATIVRIPQIELGYSLIPLLWREARIEVTAVDPAINLQRESDGEWNVMKALASKSPAAANSGPSAFTIYLDKLGIRNADIDLAPRGA